MAYIASPEADTEKLPAIVPAETVLARGARGGAPGRVLPPVERGTHGKMPCG